MAYVVKADADFPTIPVADYSQEQSIDFSTVPFVQVPIPYDDYPIDRTTPYDLWKGNGGYVKTYGLVPPPQNVLCEFPYQTMFWSEYTHTGNEARYNAYRETSLYMCSVHCPDGKLRVYYAIVDSVAEAINLFSRTWDSNDHILYVNDYEDAVHDILEDVAAWDETPSTDPQNDPDNMLPEGGEFADTDPLGFGNDDIDIPDTVQELSYSGFITAYQLDAGEVVAIGEAIFTTNTWTNLWNKFNGVSDPINYIISAVEIPFNARSQSTKNFNLGGVSVDGPNGPVPLHLMSKRYHVLDFGALTLKETWGTEKDYSTTDVAIYLPYVGVKDLDTSIIMNSSIQVKCILDSWNGELLYVVVVSNKAAAYKYLGSKGIVYRFSGNCGTVVPIGKVDYSSQFLAVAGSLAAMGVGLATGMPTGALSYTVGNEFGATGDISNGANPKMVGGGLAGMMGALTMGPKVSMSGGSGGAVARGDYQKPYLIIKQSVPKYPKDWRAHFGAPRYQEFTLGSLSGFVKCADVHADSIEGANDAERAAIEQALKAGVFIN